MAETAQVWRKFEVLRSRWRHANASDDWAFTAWRGGSKELRGQVWMAHHFGSIGMFVGRDSDLLEVLWEAACCSASHSHPATGATLKAAAARHAFQRRFTSKYRTTDELVFVKNSHACTTTHNHQHIQQSSFEQHERKKQRGIVLRGGICRGQQGFIIRGVA